MPTVGECLSAGSERLRASGSETPRLDAELLLGWAIGADRSSLIAHGETPVAAEAAARYDAAIERRAAGEPVAYLRGIKEFHGLAFAVDARALIPRPETERLVDAATAEVLARLTARPRDRVAQPVRVADVGTGSGAVAVALAVALQRRRVVLGEDVTILATDVSADALDLARENTVAHAAADGIRFEQVDDLLPGGGPPLDVVVANLPYVRSGAIDGLPVATSFEPRLALDGGADGLDIVRRLLARLPEALAADGVALLEIGGDQGDEAPAAVAASLPGWRSDVAPDLGGLPRVLRVERARG